MGIGVPLQANGADPMFLYQMLMSGLMKMKILYLLQGRTIWQGVQMLCIHRPVLLYFHRKTFPKLLLW
jgi:hypothetical protein